MTQEEIRQAFQAAMSDPNGPLMLAAAELAVIRRNLRPGGRPWKGPGGGNATAGGVAQVAWRPAAIGQVAYIELATVSVTGASAAATAALYAGSVDESRLLGFLGALSGNNPSRGAVPAPNVAGWLVYGDEPLILVVAGAAANAQVVAMAQGRVEEIADVTQLGGGRTFGV